MDTVTFWVIGKPQPKGSKQAFARKRKDGSAFATLVDTNKHAMDWQHWVKACALAEMPYDWDRQRPVSVSLEFIFERPKSHLTSKGEIRKGYDNEHTKKPDIDKLARTVLDGLTGVYFTDDCQVCFLHALKGYGPQNGCQVTITKLGRTASELGIARLGSTNRELG